MCSGCVFGVIGRKGPTRHTEMGVEGGGCVFSRRISTRHTRHTRDTHVRHLDEEEREGGLAHLCVRCSGQVACMRAAPHGAPGRRRRQTLAPDTQAVSCFLPRPVDSGVPGVLEYAHDERRSTTANPLPPG